MKYLYNSEGDFIAVLHEGVLFSPQCKIIGESYDKTVMVKGHRYLGDIVEDRLLYNHNSPDKNAVISITCYEYPSLEQFPEPPKRDSIRLEENYSDIAQEKLT